MLDFPISPTQTDAKSPWDEQVADDIRKNLEAIKNSSATAGASEHVFKVNGYFGHLFAGKNRLDGAAISKATTFQNAHLFLEEPGDGGVLDVDIRRYTNTETPINAFQRVYKGDVNSIARYQTGLSTQSIARATGQLDTQSISQWKPAINIIGALRIDIYTLRFNLASMPDSDWKPGDYITAASTTNGQNDGQFQILRIAEDNGPNVVVSKLSGQDQIGAGGSVTLNAYAYTYTNPVSAQFAAGEVAEFAGHLAPVNNGQFTIYATNRSGNNIIVKNQFGVAQNSAQGNANTNRWIYAFSAPVAADFTAIGETVETRFHTAPQNDGFGLSVSGINVGGNNLVIYRLGGTPQGSAAGTVDTNRWRFALQQSPVGSIGVGDKFFGYNTGPMDAEFTALFVNAGGSNNLVAYTPTGNTSNQGLVYSKRLLVRFPTNKAATITTDSKITIVGTASGGAFDGTFQVFATNVGGGANYNAAIEAGTLLAREQINAGGRVVAESKSIFSVRPSLTIPSALSGLPNAFFQVSTNAVIHPTRGTVPANTLLMMDLISGPKGYAKTFTVRVV